MPHHPHTLLLKKHKIQPNSRTSSQSKEAKERRKELQPRKGEKRKVSSQMAMFIWSKTPPWRNLKHSRKVLPFPHLSIPFPAAKPTLQRVQKNRNTTRIAHSCRTSPRPRAPSPHADKLLCPVSHVFLCAPGEGIYSVNWYWSPPVLSQKGSSLLEG